MVIVLSHPRREHLALPGLEGGQHVGDRRVRDLLRLIQAGAGEGVTDPGPGVFAGLPQDANRPLVLERPGVDRDHAVVFILVKVLFEGVIELVDVGDEAAPDFVGVGFLIGPDPDQGAAVFVVGQPDVVPQACFLRGGLPGLAAHPFGDEAHHGVVLQLVHVEEDVDRDVDLALIDQGGEFGVGVAQALGDVMPPLGLGVVQRVPDRWTAEVRHRRPRPPRSRCRCRARGR